MWLEVGMSWIMRNFSLAMFLLAVVFIIIHRLAIKRISDAEIVYRWVALFALGFTGIYAFIIHAFFPNLSITSIGWMPSPFQTEVALADLAFGVMGILSFNNTFGFRLATVIGSTIFAWGAAINHIYQMLQYHNFTVGNAGSWLVMDIIIPLVLIICLIKLRPGQLIVGEIRL